MKLKSLLLCSFITFGFFSFAHAETLIEPRLTIKPGATHGPYVALTFDACTGHVDERILRALIDHNIRSTIFVTARWLKRNPLAIAEIKSRPDLFEIENHGARHLPAVDAPQKVFGLAAAGTSAAVEAEVKGGADAVKASFGQEPKWFRGATGKYTLRSEKQIQNLGFKIAGYSVLGDGGAEFSADKTAATFSKAVDGDVIIAHINQPNKPAGAGVVEGILKLKASGFVFLRLQDGV